MLEPLPSDRDAQHHNCRACDDFNPIQRELLKDVKCALLLLGFKP